MHQAGFDKPVKWLPDTGGNATTMNITGWDVTDGGDLVDITHTGCNGEQAFLAAIKRCPVSVSANFDTDQAPSALGIRFGRKGTITAYLVAGGAAWSLHVIIESVPYKSVVNGAVSYTFTAKSDSITASGAVVPSITYPF